MRFRLDAASASSGVLPIADEFFNNDDGSPIENNSNNNNKVRISTSWTFRCSPGGFHVPALLAEYIALPEQPQEQQPHADDGDAASLKEQQQLVDRIRSVHTRRQALWASSPRGTLETCMAGADCDLHTCNDPVTSLSYSNDYVETPSFSCAPSSRHAASAFEAPLLWGEPAFRDPAIAAARKHQWMPVHSVPGSVHNDLLYNGLIGEPQHGLNEFRQKWISHCSWVYRCEFRLEAPSNWGGQIALQFHGIDTVARISLNGHGIGNQQFANQFVRWDVPVPWHIVKTQASESFRVLPVPSEASSLAAGDGVNVLEVFIESPARYVVQRSTVESTYHIPHQNYPFSERHWNLLRKSACSWGWDWGPTTLSSGLCGPVDLVAYERAFIKDVSVRCGELSNTPAHSQTGRVFGTLQVDLSLDISDQTRLSAEPIYATVGVQSSLVQLHGDPTFLVSESAVHERVSFDCSPEALWWPRGAGKQTLLPCLVTLRQGNGDILHTHNMEIGLRHVVLRREPQGDTSAGNIKSSEVAVTSSQAAEESMLGRQIASRGETFEFVVNGVGFFCKGADWIPCNVLENRRPDTFVDSLLVSAASANFNMLRVWGGGVYERHSFYRTCDALGIMIWQDFMFSCACYPASDVFLESVAKEACHQVNRLAKFPCVVLMCGSNENEEGILCFPETNETKASDAERYYDDYNRLQDVLESAVTTAGQIWWPSSPSNGSSHISHRAANSCTCHGGVTNHDPSCVLSYQQPHPNVQNIGDSHYWGVWHGNGDFSEYLKVSPRFCSEFGFQSFPSVGAIEKDWLISASLSIQQGLLALRQRSPARGNQQIIDHVVKHLPDPASMTLLDWSYPSQVCQALAIKLAVEHFRSVVACRGAVFWQLNDIANFASWSALEADGAWKVLMYSAQKFFSPVLLSAVVKNEQLHVYLSSDGSRPFRQVVWRVALVNFHDGSEVSLSSGTTQSLAQIGAVDSILVADIPRPSTSDSCYVHLEYRVDDEDLQENFFLLKSLRDIFQHRTPPRIHWEWVGADEVLLSTLDTSVAAFVAPVPDKSIVFSEGFFMLRPNHARLLRVLKSGSNGEAPRELRFQAM